MFTASSVRQVKIGFGAGNDRIKEWETKVGFSISKKDEDESDLRDQKIWATNQRLAGRKVT